jgi:hypothetical protein
VSRTYILKALRLLVRERARHCCEYCGYPGAFAFYSHHVDHIVSEKHGGGTYEGNLALACRSCNLNKGSDIGTLIDGDRDPVRLYNPRYDRWKDHFILVDNSIQPLSKIGYGTAMLLQYNHLDRILERQLLIGRGLWVAPVGLVE